MNGEVKPKFRLAIWCVPGFTAEPYTKLTDISSGGGMAGLCFAVGLSKYPDIEVSVYEAARSFKEVGAGVMMWGRVWRVFTLLGLTDELRTLAGVPLTDPKGIS